MPMRRIAAVSALLLSVAASADTISFPAGSLIIPMNSSFQTKCGQVSAYGLVYRILQSNGPGHVNELNPITVYVVNNPAKGSPNRCVPTNTTSLYTGSGGVSSANADAGMWMDGCDFTVTSSSGVPVVKFDANASSWPTSGIFSGSITTYNNRSAGAWPPFVDSISTTSGAFTEARYGGAPFVIAASDAQRVYALLKNHADSAKAPNIFFDTFTTGAGGCSGLNNTGETTSGGITYSSMNHFVDIHQSTILFNANVQRRLNKSPSAFALYDPDLGRNGAIESNSSRSGASGPFVLQKYLHLAGLWFKNTGSSYKADTEGCPNGNRSTCISNYSSDGGLNHGSIYDRFTTWDIDYTGGSYPKGILNQKTGSGTPVYSLFWAPHWNVDSDSRGDDQNGVNSVVEFVNTGGNILGECASLPSFENIKGGGNYSTGYSPPRLLYDGGTNYIYSDTVYNTNASSTSTTVPINNAKLKNCSDPGVSKPCVDFGAPGNLYSQIGDWIYTGTDGRAVALKGTARPFVSRMLTYRSSTASNDNFDVFVMGQENASKGTIVYVGGHDVSDDPVGSRIVLNSMLNLTSVAINNERSAVSPTVVLGTTMGDAGVDQVITPTFVAKGDMYGVQGTYTTDNDNNAAGWNWPGYTGEMRSFRLSALVTAAGSGSYSDAYDKILGQLFDAALMADGGMMPVPGNRNLFTWVGGYPADSGTLRFGAATRNNVAQLGWAAETIDGTVLGTCGSTTNCVDVMGFNKRVSTPTYDDGVAGNNTVGLKLVRGADQICDVAQMVAYGTPAYNNGNDWTTCHANNMQKFEEKLPMTKAMLQRVRGFCHATGNLDGGNLTPADNACFLAGQTNRADLGGLVRSAVAALTPSANVPSSAKRPVVAFVGGWDGQLHAFYLGGGAGYVGPSSTVSFNEENSPASVDGGTAKFPKNWSTDFASSSLPAPGTELWSYLPASQLPRLFSNDARVDSSPVVMDVFADFSGTGKREWHSVLMVSLGRTSTELFAIDVTNPLTPRLLWDNTGSLFGTTNNPPFSPNILMTSAGGNLPGDTVAPVWAMVADPTVDGGFRETNGYTRSDGGVAYPVERKAYDFTDLGGASGISSSQIRVGMEPVYAVFVSSNLTGGNKGIAVHAIEVSTGQLMWEWVHEYDVGGPPDDNVVPPIVSVITGADGAARLLFGDDEGRVWELDAATGRNRNYISAGGSCTLASPCQRPLFDTGSTASNPQPVSTNIAVARVPESGIDAGVFAGYENQRVLIFGTSGDGLALPSTVQGTVHVTTFEDKSRNSAGMVYEATATPTTPFLTLGVGERAYGNIVVSGYAAFGTTATTDLSDMMSLPGDVGGRTWAIDLYGTTSNVQVSLAAAGALGGVTSYGGGVLTSQTGKLNYTMLSSASGNPNLAAHSATNAKAGVGDDQGLTYRLMMWLRSFLGL